MKADRILDECLRIARRKNSTHPLRRQGWKYIHWSFVVQDGKILSVGVNRNAGIEVMLPGLRDGKKIHAEQDAYRRVEEGKNRLQLQRKWYMVNVRLNRKGEVRNSDPCYRCRYLLMWLGIDRIIFTIDEGWATWTNPYVKRGLK
jgi:tRNA(Arg) A34 adenosine deaminase TadA